MGLYRWILQTLSDGASIEIEDPANISLKMIKKQQHTKKLCSNSEKMLFWKEICQLLQKGVLQHVTNSEKAYVYSIFLQEKKDNSINFKSQKINRNLVYQHFEMDNLKSLNHGQEGLL